MNARSAYNSTNDAETIALELSDGFLAIMFTPEEQTLPWAIAEKRPPIAIGKQAAKYKRPVIMSVGAFPPRMPVFKRTITATINPYNP